MELKLDKCCGCAACINKCPKNAIELLEDNCGFLYPKINNELCVNCGLCNSVCPQSKKSNNLDNPTFIMASSKEKNILNNSSSGGMFYQFANYILSNNGYVFGAYQDETFKVYHTYISDINDISKLQLSKYIQSDIKNCFNELKVLLSENKPILFVGTPCQCAGLKSFLGKDYDNLFIVDLVCHGVPSFKELKTYLREKFKDIQLLKYRRKELQKPDIILKINNKYIVDEQSAFLKGFLSNKILRNSCYGCEYSTIPRFGDLTIGDAWGKNKVKLNFTSNKISIISINSQKGQFLFDKIKQFIDYQTIENKNGAVNSNMFKSGAPLEQIERKKKFEKNWKLMKFTDAVNSI